MRIKAINVENILPVKKFQVDNLADLVVIAGPNGVGKTRLITGLLKFFQNCNGSNPSFIIEATCQNEEEVFGAKFIDTSIKSSSQKLKGLLQKNRRRRNLTSSIVYFESNRSIQNVQPLGFQFDFPDPWDEELGWNLSFGGLANRWQDTQHAIFKKIQSQKSYIAARAIHLKNSGHDSMNLDFSDPLTPFREAFFQLLGPKVLAAADIQKQTLMYEYQGEERPVNTLSSGEKEVLNIAFDYILRKPSNCIVFFDEPELHLHPELLIKLISTLKNVGENNQFILISHSPDVISSSLDDSVIFLTPPDEAGSNQGVLVTPQDENTEALSRLGHSVGVVSLGKKIVLIEGKSSSLDKQTYSHILKNRFSNLVLLPSGGKGNLQTFEVILEQVLDKTLWGVDFYMLADRDAAPSNRVGSQSESESNTRFKALSKYHLENYFLNAETLALCFSQMEDDSSWLRSPEQIDAVLREIAREHLGYAASLIVSKRVRDAAGNVDIMIKGAHSLPVEDFVTQIGTKVSGEAERISMALDINRIKQMADDIYKELEQLLDNSDDQWKSDIPGKVVLSKFAARANIPIGRLKTLYIKHAQKSQDDPFAEIYKIFKVFSES
jgi:ABC-type cobalamin/Fe3+-siderophores transport system ATPase subunit